MKDMVYMRIYISGQNDERGIWLSHFFCRLAIRFALNKRHRFPRESEVSESDEPICINFARRIRANRLRFAKIRHVWFVPFFHGETLRERSGNGIEGKGRFKRCSQFKSQN